MQSAKTAIDRFAVAMAEFTIKFRWLIIIVSLAAAGFVGTGAQRLEFSSNYRTFFSPENPELRNFEAFQATYTKSDNILFVLVPKDGTDVFARPTLNAVAAITERGWQMPFATRVDSLTNFQFTYAEGDDLIVEDLVADPDGTSDEALAARRAQALAEPLLRDLIISADGRATAINVVLTYPEVELDEVPRAVAAARALRDDIEAAYPHLDIYISGTSMLNNAFSEAVLNDLTTLLPAMVLVILIVTALAVRSISATIATLAVIILSCIVAMGWAGFMGIKLAGPSPSATVVILTLAIADSIHILVTMRDAMRRGASKRDAIVESIRANFVAVFITSLTTVVGFLALNFSDSPPFRDFGNISAVGVAVAWWFSITLLPALLVMMPLRVKVHAEEDQAGERRRGLGVLADIVLARYRLFFFGTLAGALALTAFIPTITLSDQFKNYFDPRIEFRADTDKVIDYFGFYPMEFSLQAAGPGGVTDPAFLAKLDAYTTWLRSREEVTHVFSIADIMKRLNRNLNADDPSFYRLPEDAELSAQYLLLFELSLPYGLDLNDRINVDKSATRVTATLDGNVSTKQIRTLLKDSAAWFEANAPEIAAPATGPQVMFTFIAQRNVESMISGTIIAILAIGVIMIFALRDVRLGLLSMVPNALPILTAFGIWAIVRGEVGFSVAAIASLSLGIVIDDTVHFMTKYVRARRQTGLSIEDSIRYSYETVGTGIVLNTIILMAGFLLLTVSAFKINLELGMLTSMTIALALIIDVLLLPGLLLLTTRDRKSAASASPA